jgi:hypothetical protein
LKRLKAILSRAALKCFENTSFWLYIRHRVYTGFLVSVDTARYFAGVNELTSKGDPENVWKYGK